MFLVWYFLWEDFSLFVYQIFQLFIFVGFFKTCHCELGRPLILLWGLKSKNIFALYKMKTLKMKTNNSNKFLKD